jgi:hypothetical protein
MAMAWVNCLFDFPLTSADGRLLYRDGSWSGDGISVSQNAVLVDGSFYPIQSRTPFYADLTHHERRIVITE